MLGYEPEGRENGRRNGRTYPEDQLRVVPMPAVPAVLGEEARGMFRIVLGHEDAHPLLLGRTIPVILLPDDAQEQGPGRVHDGDVRQKPTAVVDRQRVDGAQEEGMVRHRSHRIVRYARRHRTSHPGRIGQKRIETAVAALEVRLASGRSDTRFGGIEGHVHRRGRCISRRNGPAQSSGWHRRAESDADSLHTCSGTTGIRP